MENRILLLISVPIVGSLAMFVFCHQQQECQWMILSINLNCTIFFLTDAFVGYENNSVWVELPISSRSTLVDQESEFLKLYYYDHHLNSVLEWPFHFKNYTLTGVENMIIPINSFPPRPRSYPVCLMWSCPWHQPQPGQLKHCWVILKL